jgi:hypothetical protein
MIATLRANGDCDQTPVAKAAALAGRGLEFHPQISSTALLLSLLLPMISKSSLRSELFARLRYGIAAGIIWLYENARSGL